MPMTSATSVNIVLDSTSHELVLRAEKLAEHTDLPINSTTGGSCDFHLVYTENHVELQPNPSRQQKRFRPFRIDFLEKGRIHHRILSTTLKDPLPRALGIKPGLRPPVTDTTAGLGMDGISLAWLGCEVTLLERSPIVHALLEDALLRAKKDPQLQKIISERLTLLNTDSITYLKTGAPISGTIFIDPMFPEITRGPLNKKEMRILRAIVGNDIDGEELTTAALMSGAKRVVVKRPKGATTLCQQREPTFETRMKSGRFDVYLTSHL